MLSKIQNYLVPSFLKRLDFWLMTHKPHVWRTRGHFVVFYGVILAFIFFLLGLFYPQTLYNANERSSYHEKIALAFTIISFFLVLGAIFGWWFSIQKFDYKRTNIKHFLLEIGIYSIGIFTLWSVLVAFFLGFQYNRCYRLELNKQEDKDWFFNHHFSQFGYMPHVDSNKLLDINKYFQNGEKLIDIQYNRGIATLPYRQYNDKDHSSYIDSDFSSSLSSLDWEFKTLNKQIQVPSGKKVSDYVNTLIGNDSLRIVERQRNNINDNDWFFDVLMSSLDYNSISELTENTYPRFFHLIDFSSKSKSLLTKQIEDWKNQALFLESLDNKEITAYKAFLTYLANYYKDNDSILVSIIQPQLIAYKNFYNNHSLNTRILLDINDYEYSPQSRNIDIGNNDKNAIAGEKLQKLLSVFDSITVKKYCHWLAKLHGDFSKYNIKNPFINQSIDKTYSKIQPSSSDSLLLYDYYHLKFKNYDSYQAFFTNAYAHFILKKYTPQDFDRIHQLLTVNGFPDETPQYKDNKIQKIALLFYVEKYRYIVSRLENKRDDFNESLTILWSGFSLLYCTLFALVFYITTLSTGIQFWVSLFISGMYWAFMIFIGNLMRWGRSYEGGTGNSSVSFIYLFVIIHSVLFALLILSLYYTHNKWKYANLIINSIFLSGLGAVISAMNYWKEHIETIYYSIKEYNPMPLADQIRIYSNVIFVSILIYAISAWLFKRHLTYPKKK